MVPNLLAAAALVVWVYLIAGRGGFWLASERDDGGPAPAAWPAVTAVIPARDEAEGVGQTIASLLQQDYPGAFSIILVDDQSSDGTADVARQAAAAFADRLTVVPGAALPTGWTGKLWAMKQGVAQAMIGDPAYLLFTDADIVYDRDTLTRLVSQAQANGLVLNSLMVALRCESFAERAFVPAFIFFFQMLYPFAWVNNPDRTIAAAAGGCMLVRRDALVAAGGIEAIRGALIDDCALARSLKPQGPIRLSLTQRVHSIRGYATVQDIRRMVARSAYAQLALFAAAARRNGGRHGAGLSGAGCSGVVRPRVCAGARPARLGAHDRCISADTAVLPAVAALGPLFAADRARLHGIYR